VEVEVHGEHSDQSVQAIDVDTRTVSPGDRFDGTGYCFLEFPGQRASALEGQFFAQPPEVWLAEPDTETFVRKQAFETERLRDWLDVGVS
jgi:hypothetical protein